MARAPVDVFRFTDYRDFLRAYRDAEKSRKSPFSLRNFSRRVGLKSPNYFKLVADGERNLSAEMAGRFAAGCGLQGDALDYFCELVAFNQAESTTERQRHYQRLQGFPRFRRVHRLDAAQDSYHSDWYLPAIRELVLRPDFRPDPAWVAGQLMPTITTAQAKSALDTLLKLGLLEEDGQGGLRQVHALVDTEDRPLGHHVVKYHRTMMAMAAEAIDRVPREQREITALTLCVSEEEMDALKHDLARVRAELLDRYGQSEHAERVVQVNFQMFPMSGTGEKKS